MKNMVIFFAVIFALTFSLAVAQQGEEKLVNLIFADDLKKGPPSPLQAKEVGLAYYHEGDTKWVTLKGTTNEEGTVTFRVPAGKSGESATFVFGSSEVDKDKIIDELKNGAGRGFRIPPHQNQESLTIKIDKNSRITNPKGSFQAWSPYR